MKRQRLLLTGGSGLLALNWACAVRDQWDVILGTHLHSVDLQGVASCRIDLDDPERLDCQIRHLAPDLIVNTAGLTDVDRCQSSPNMAAAVNAELARNVATIAARLGVQLIHISTDHLFAGDRALSSEDDVPYPLNEYARSKLLGEVWVQEVFPQALVVRTNFFGWGHVGRQSFSDWIIYSLRAEKAISLFDDVHFTPILADVLALTAHGLAGRGASGIFNIVGDERVSKYEFGYRLAQQFSLPMELIQRSKVFDANLNARRPRDMSLANAKARKCLGTPMGSLDDYFEALRAQEQRGRRLALLQGVST